MSATDELIPVEEAARRLGVARVTIYRWAREGALTLIHGEKTPYGHRRYVSDSELAGAEERLGAIRAERLKQRHARTWRYMYKAIMEEKRQAEAAQP